jgi:predicted metalloprotease with PDZ domain
MRAASSGGPINEADILAAVASVAGPRRGRAMATELSRWVHGTDDLPLADLLGRFGATWRAQPATLAQRWGLRVAESALTGMKVTHVLRGGAAERAGLAAGEEVIAAVGWRLRRLDEVQALLPKADAASAAAAAPLELLVSRDQRVRSLSIEVPDSRGHGNVALAVDAAAGASARALRRAWLAG